MAQHSELITDITANNKQFLQSVGQAEAKAKSFGITSSKAFQAAALGLTSLATAVVTSGLAEGFKSIDKINDSAKRLRITTDSTQFLEYAAKMSGSSIEELEASLKKLNISLANADKFGSPAGDALAKLGLSASKLKSMGIDEAFFDIIDSLKKLRAEERIGVGTALFGKPFQNLTELTEANIEQLIKAFKESGGALNLKGFDDLADKVDKISLRWERFKRSLFLNVGGPLLDLFDKINNSWIAKLVGNSISTSAGSEAGIKASTLSGMGKGGSLGQLYSSISAKDVVNNPANNKDNQLIAVLANLATSLTRLAGFNRSTFQDSASDSVLKASTNILKLADASSVAAGALKELSKMNLKDVFGLTNSADEGQKYLDSILTPIQQIQDKDFTALANRLRDDISKGVDPNSALFQSGLNTLNRWAERQQVGEGESKSGMIAAAKLISDAAAKVKPDNQKVQIELKYDQDGIIKAFISDTTFATKAGQIVQDLAAAEAASTVASGG